MLYYHYEIKTLPLTNIKRKNMKILKNGLTLILISFIVSCSSDDSATSSPPFNGDVYLRSQQEVNDFGANNHSGVNGNLTIGDQNGPRDITNLGPLSSLTFIAGDLDINYNDGLTSLNGLSNIETVNGFLHIGENNSLENLNGIANINSVESIQIAFNYSLSQIDGLQNITSLTGELSIFRCDNLVNINGLENISQIGGTLNLANIPISNVDSLSNLNSVAGNISIYDCDNLEDLDGLSNLQVIGGTLYIGKYPFISPSLNGNSNLTSIQGLSNITHIGGNLEIGDNESLLDLNGLQNLESIDGELYLFNCKFQDLNHLNNLTSIGSDLRLENNPSLSDLNGLGSLTAIGGNCKIYNNDALINIDDLNNLISIEGVINLQYNDNLLNIDNTFDGLASVEGLYISHSYFTSFNMLNNLNTIGYIRIYDNDQLTSIQGFSSLNTINSILTISGCDILTSITGFQNLSSVEHLMLGADIGSNFDLPDLSDISGFSNLITINGDLEIERTSLTNLTPLSNVNSVLGDVLITYNNSLSNFCGLNNLFQNNGLTGEFYAGWNSYNPSQADMENGNCN